MLSNLYIFLDCQNLGYFVHKAEHESLGQLRAANLAAGQLRMWTAQSEDNSAADIFSNVYLFYYIIIIRLYLCYWFNAAYLKFQNK